MTKQKPGEAFAQAMKQRADNRQSETRRRQRALAEYEEREAVRLRDQQHVMRADFYARHPELRDAA